MSLPTKQEVVQEAQTKGFSDRVKFGAKLGHQHAKNEKLSSFLSDLRSVRYIFQLPRVLVSEMDGTVLIPTFFSALFCRSSLPRGALFLASAFYNELETNLRILV